MRRVHECDKVLRQQAVFHFLHGKFKSVLEEEVNLESAYSLFKVPVDRAINA